MIETKLVLKPGLKELYLLNKPFSQLLRESHEENYEHFHGRISSYHDPLSNEPDWFRYCDLGAGLEIIIAGSKDALSTKEMFDFMIEHNGFALSRDNLFMVWHIYVENFKRYLQKAKKEFSIVAIAHPNQLPEHNNGPKIAPMLKIKYNDGKISPSYDWSWIDSQNMEIKNFIFFKKTFLTTFLD